MNEFKIHKIWKSEKYYITYDGHKVTMKYIPKMIPKLTREVLDIFYVCNGKINNAISGRLIEFPTKEDAQSAADKLLGKIVADKLFE